MARGKKAERSSVLSRESMDLLNYEEKPRSRTRFFWWSVFIILLSAAGFASWIGCFYVVSHPEDPKCYALLKKLKRLDPPRRFEVVQVPTGDFLTVARLLDRFGKLGPAEMARENARMLRQYLTNYREAKKRVLQVDGKAVAQNDVVYVVGRFDVLASRALADGDLFPMGGVVLSQSLDSPQVLLESVFPAEPKMGKLIQNALPIGSDIVLERSRDLLALLHVDRLADGRMQFTAVPLPYNAWQSRRSDVTIHLKSPEELEKSHPDFSLRVASGMPIVRGDELAKATAAYGEFRRAALSGPGGEKDEEKRRPDFVRFDDTHEETDAAVTPRIVKTPTPAPVRALPTPAPTQPLVARPMIVAPAAVPTPAPTPTPVPTPAPTPAPKAAQIAKDTLTPKTAPMPEAVPAVVPRIVTPPTPAATAATTAPASPPSATIPAVPEPASGPMVPRRIVNVNEAAQLAGETDPAPALLTGDFYVAAVEGQTLELQDANADATTDKPAVVVKVRVAEGQTPPRAGDRVRRGAARGLVVRRVVRESDGRITIETTEP